LRSGTPQPTMMTSLILTGLKNGKLSCSESRMRSSHSKILRQGERSRNESTMRTQ
jgi:hypothetical protein